MNQKDNNSETAEVTTNDSSSLKSIFDTGYGSTSYADPDGEYVKVYLSLVKEGSTAEETGDTVFWEIYVQQYSERHGTQFTPVRTLSECNSFFTGSNTPVQFSLTGLVAVNPDNDHRIKLLKRFINDYRLSTLASKKKHLRLFIINTCMDVVIKTIAISQKSTIEDFATVSIGGLAYNYKNLSSPESTYYRGASFKVGEYSKSGSSSSSSSASNIFDI